jgi:hypothetical protein
MHRRIIAIAVTLCASVAVAAEKPNVTVTLKTLTERRELAIEKTPFSGWNTGIELTLHVDGPDVKGARKFGMLKVSKAVDDAGTDLNAASKETPKQNILENYEEVREPQSFGMDSNQPKPTGFDMELKLPALSARSAKSIAQVSATMQVLVGGEKKIVEVKQIKQNYGKTIDDPALKQLGVTFELIDPSKASQGAMFMGDPKKSVSANISGNIDAIASVQIVDAKGKKLSQGAMWSDMGGKRAISYEMEKNLSDDMVLQLEVWPGQKTVTVPIELKDIKLP